jgi:hypothetical protein
LKGVESLVHNRVASLRFGLGSLQVDKAELHAALLIVEPGLETLELPAEMGFGSGEPPG